MPVQCNVVLYPVKDLDRAKGLYAALLGTDPHVDSPSARRSASSPTGPCPT